jgi:sRNA-binding protein
VWTPVTAADSPHSGGKIRITTNQNNPLTKFGDDLTRSSASKAERYRKQRADAVIGSALMDATEKGAVKMTTKSETNIAALAAMFPAAFSAEPWQEHRPLKIGIGNDLVARGVLGKRVVNAALKRYVDRLMYQKCLAAGGARVDLEGNVAGEVSNEHRSRAEMLVARIEARQLAETAAESEKAVRHAAMPSSAFNNKAVFKPLPPQTTPPSGSGGLGLADLKRAAQERRARQEAGRAGGPASQAGI